MEDVKWLQATMALTGVGVGATMGLHNLIIIEVMGLKNLALVLGTTTMMAACGVLCIGPFVG